MRIWTIKKKKKNGVQYEHISHKIIIQFQIELEIVLFSLGIVNVSL